MLKFIHHVAVFIPKIQLRFAFCHIQFCHSLKNSSKHPVLILGEIQYHICTKVQNVPCIHIDIGAVKTIQACGYYPSVHQALNENHEMMHKNNDCAPIRCNEMVIYNKQILICSPNIAKLIPQIRVWLILSGKLFLSSQWQKHYLYEISTILLPRAARVKHSRNEIGRAPLQYFVLNCETVN